MSETLFSRKGWLVTGLLCVFCLTFGLPVSDGLSIKDAAAQGEFLGEGSRVPPLSFTDLTGRQHDWTWTGESGLSVGFFWIPLSPPSLLEVSDLDEVYRKQRDFGLRVAAVEATGLDSAGIEGVMSGYKRLYGYPKYPIVPDTGSRLREVFGLGQEQLPATFFIGADGAVLKVVTGGYGAETRAELEGIVRRGLKGELAPPETPERTIYSSASPHSRSLPALVGDRISTMRVKDLSGKPHSLIWPGEYGLTVFFFWSPWSAPSFEEMVFLSEVEDRAGEYGLRVLAVEAGGLSIVEIKAALEKYERFYGSVSLPVIPGTEAGIVSTFGLPDLPMPETYMVDQNGMVVYRLSGFREQDKEEMVTIVRKRIKLPSGILESVLRQGALE